MNDPWSLPVFYAHPMVAPSNSYSPSAQKPAQVVESWKKLGLPLSWREPEPVTAAQLCLVHDANFVQGVLSQRIANGFGNRSAEVAASLPWTSGCLLSAARYAWKNGRAAAAPCSGFHHAGYDHAQGFCTFNGLMVTAAVLHEEGAQRIGIFDCDMHYGDGTEDIISRLGAPGWIRHFTAGAKYGRAEQAPEFFSQLPVLLDAMTDCEVVLYQAGADPHLNDPLGGWLTTAQLKERDKVVFVGLRERGVPVAWNLAGGYQREADGSIPRVLEIHDNTLQVCVEVFRERTMAARP